MTEKTWTWAFVGTFYDDINRTIEVCRACDVKALELHPANVADMRDSEIDDLRERLAGDGIAVSSFHLPFSAGDDIASFYESTRRAAVDRMIDWITIAGRLGARVGVQHPTVNRDPAEENGLDRYYEQLYRSLSEMLPAAREAGVIIGLENMTPGERGGRFFSQAAHFSRLAQEFDDPQVGFVYDTGHALMSAGAQALDILEAMGTRVAAWHLADNAGDRDSHLAPGHGAVDWDGVFQRAAHLGFSEPVTMETGPWGPGPDYAVETWQRSVQELEELVGRALSTG